MAKYIYKNVVSFTNKIILNGIMKIEESEMDSDI